MPSNRSPLVAIFLTVFVDVLGLTLVLPLLPYYAEHFGATPFIVGVLGASYPVCQLFSGPLLGRMSDRVGRRPTLLVSQCGTLAAFLMMAFANALWMLFVGRIIDGLTAGNLTVAQAYISDVTKPENRTKAFAIIGISFGMGFLIGPAISGILAQRFGYSAPLFVAAALSALSIVLTATLVREPPRPEIATDAGRSFDFGRFFDRPATRRRLLEYFAFTLSFSSLMAGLALFLKHRLNLDVEKTGYVYAYAGLIGALIQGGAIGRLVKRLGEEKLALLGFATMVVGQGLLGAVFGIPLLLVLIAISGFGTAVTRPCLTTLLTKSVGREEQGAVLGVSASLASISQMTGQLLAGLFIDRSLFAMYGLTSGAFALVGFGLLLRGPREESPAALETGRSPTETR